MDKKMVAVLGLGPALGPAGLRHLAVAGMTEQDIAELQEANTIARGTGCQGEPIICGICGQGGGTLTRRFKLEGYEHTPSCPKAAGEPEGLGPPNRRWRRGRARRAR